MTTTNAQKIAQEIRIKDEQITMADIAMKAYYYGGEHEYDNFHPEIGLHEIKHTSLETICRAMHATVNKSEHVDKYTFRDGSILAHADYEWKPFRSYANCNCDKAHGHDSEWGCPNEDER